MMRDRKKLFIPLVLYAVMILVISFCGTKAEAKICVHKWVAATCTAPKTCSKCGATSGVKLGHNYAAANCTTAKHCTRCGLKVGSPLGHSNKITYTSATCTTEGFEISTCSRCGNVSKKMIQSRLGHIEVPGDAYNKVTPATCTSNGSHVYYCGRCKAYLRTATIPKLGHDTKVTYTAAACETPGYQITTCSRCSYYNKQQTCSALGHIEVPDAKYNIVVDSTCSKEGYHKYYCGRCSKELRTVTIGKKDHKMSWVTKKPASCTETGYRNYECSTCGYTTNSSTIEKLEHSLSYSTVQYPRVHREGINRATCSTCGGHWDTAIAALPSTCMLNVGLLAQDNDDCCGSCCAAMVCQYLRMNNSGSVTTLGFFDAIGQGTSTGAIAKQLNTYLGLSSDNGYAAKSATASATSVEDFQDLMIRSLMANRPVLLQIKMTSSDRSLFGYTSGGHYVLVTGIEETPNGVYAYVNDPFNSGYSNSDASTHTGQKKKLNLADLHRICVNKHTSDNGSKWGAFVIDSKAYQAYVTAK